MGNNIQNFKTPTRGRRSKQNYSNNIYKKASNKIEMKDRLNDRIESWANMSKPEIRKELEEIGISKDFEMYEKRQKTYFMISI